MSFEAPESEPMIPVLTEHSGDGAMVRKERWDEIQRLFQGEHRSISAIARELDMDRKTVRRCVRANVAARPDYRRPRHYCRRPWSGLP